MQLDFTQTLSLKGWPQLKEVNLIAYTVVDEKAEK